MTMVDTAAQQNGTAQAESSTSRDYLVEQVRQLDDRIAQLRNELHLAQQGRTDAERRHAEDVNYIGECLLQQAQERSWCSDFDRFVEDLNNSLHHKLRRRLRSYEVETALRVVLRIEASNEDDAEDVARSSIEDITRDIGDTPNAEHDDGELINAAAHRSSDYEVRASD